MRPQRRYFFPLFFSLPRNFENVVLINAQLLAPTFRLIGLELCQIIHSAYTLVLLNRFLFNCLFSSIFKFLNPNVLRKKNNKHLRTTSSSLSIWSLVSYSRGSRRGTLESRHSRSNAHAISCLTFSTCDFFFFQFYFSYDND